MAESAALRAQQQELGRVCGEQGAASSSLCVPAVCLQPSQLQSCLTPLCPPQNLPMQLHIHGNVWEVPLLQISDKQFSGPVCLELVKLQ